MKKHASIRSLALTGILVAIVLFLGLTPYGIIPIGPANMSFLCVPIVIGTLACSLRVGILLGGIFGLTSVFKAFTAPSALVIPLMGVSPVYVILMSVVARLLIPVTIFFVYRLMTRRVPRTKTAVALASALGSLTNTVLYLGLMLLFYVICGLDSAAVLSVVAGVGALNGSLELVAAVVVCVPILAALRRSAKIELGQNY